MPISLKIVSFKGLPYENSEALIIDREGGSIGRLDSCNVVLPDKDKTISRHHALISYEDGAFILSDTSLGGTFIDDDPVPINNSSVTLEDGMLLRIGEYQIEVNLLPESNEVLSDSADIVGGPFVETEKSPFDDDNALLMPAEHIEHAVNDASDIAIVSEEVSSNLLDQADDFVSSAEPNENFSSLHDSFIPPSPTGERQANNEMPDDFNFEDLFNLDSKDLDTQPDIPVSKTEHQENILLDVESPDDSSQVSPAPGIVEPGADKVTSHGIESAAEHSASQHSNLYKVFLQGAEIPQTDIEALELDARMRNIGAMFRQFVESTVAVLRSRAEFKSLFRVTVTTIKKADNNPLKFSVTTDEALQHLLNDGQGGFKKPVDAITEGFQDILNHQMAMQAGIQASLQEILRQFEPGRIEKQFEEGLVLNKKAKCWERYNDIYAQLADTVIDDFYGDAFADAYEKQMKQIMSVNQNKE